MQVSLDFLVVIRNVHCLIGPILVHTGDDYEQDVSSFTRISLCGTVFLRRFLDHSITLWKYIQQQIYLRRTGVQRAGRSFVLGNVQPFKRFRAFGTCLLI